MNNFKCLVVFLICFFLTCLSSNATNLDSMVKKTYLDKTSTIAISVKDIKTGKAVYEYNSQKLMNPASVQKLFTMRSVYKQLGQDYRFLTSAYLDKNNNLYIKLSGDPSFTKNNLIYLVEAVKSSFKDSVNDIVLDPYVFDNKQWGIGWMWDDDTSNLLPKYSPFSINENKIDFVVEPSKHGNVPIIKSFSSYNMPFVNLLKNGSSNDVVFERMPWISSDLTYLSGTVNSQIKFKLPVNSPEKYFISELCSVLSKVGIQYSGDIKTAPVPKDAKKIAEVQSDSLAELIALTLKDSNNFYSEMLFKAAAASYTKSKGSTENAVLMFEKEFNTIPDDGHVFVDGCGISRNNLISADWITSALNKIAKEDDFNTFSKLIAKPMEGTLSNRLLNISLNVRAKTGTASGISSIAGYIDTQSGVKYSFAILVQNHNIDSNEVKKFEDKLINEFYKM